MGPLRLGLIGAGEFGARYLESLLAIPGVELAWVCDLNPTLAQAAAARFPGARATADFREVCGDPRVEGVIVVTPEKAHRDVVVEALGRGKHVVVEKPLATTEEDGLAMVAAAEQSGKLLMTAFLLRFDYRYARLAERLPQIDPVRNIYAYRNFDRSLFELYSRTHSFVENAIHDIDLILWYVRSQVLRAHGFCRNTLGEANPDINWGVLEFANGTLAALQTSWLYPPQPHETLQWNAGIQVMGARGVLEVRFDGDGFRANTETTGQVVLDQTGWATIHDEPRGAFGAMLRHYMAAMRGDTPYRGTTPREAIESMRVARLLAADAEARSQEVAG